MILRSLAKANGRTRIHEASEGVSIDALPDEILAKVVSHLDDKERCNVVPLVSKHWLHVHQNFPPRPKAWSIGLHQPISLPMVRWFLRIAGYLEDLDVSCRWAEDPQAPCFLPQMLALAATAAPQLRTLTLIHLALAQPLLQSLALLSHLRELSLHAMSFADGGAVAGIACLSALRALEVIRFGEVFLISAAGRQGDQLWEALSHLKNLSEICFSDFKECDVDDGMLVLEGGMLVEGVHADFFQHVSLVTQIRSLRLAVSCECLVDGDTLHPAFGHLSQLTAFQSRYLHPCTAAAPILALPSLRDLSVIVERVRLQPGDFVIASQHLTHLDIFGCRNHSAEYILHATTALSSLRKLHLTAAGLDTFPVSVASRLCQLHELDLSCNCFRRLPPALQHIQTLTTLDLSSNEDLQLDGRGQATLKALTDLRLLHLKKHSSDASRTLWSAGSVQIIFDIGRLCHQLEVQF